MSTAELRYLREFKKVLQLIMRARKFQFSQLKGIGHKSIIKLSIATEGFGLLGEISPLNGENIKALSRMQSLYKLWYQTLKQAGFSEKEIENILAPSKILLKEAEAVSFVRSHKSTNLVAPLSDILARESLRLEKAKLLEGYEEEQLSAESKEEGE